MPSRNEAIHRPRHALHSMPVSDEENLMKLQDQTEEYLREANPADHDELTSTIADAVSRKYFIMQSAKNEHDRARRDGNKAGKNDLETLPSPLSRPSCPLCSNRMELKFIQPDRPGFDLRTFECPKCSVREDMIIQFRMDDGI